jgi:LemA protein
MDGMMVGLVIVAGIGLLVVIWFFATYNRFVSLRQHIGESASGIDVELKRRYELIPNLVETVKGYASHERATLEAVMAARARAMAAGVDPAATAREEPGLRAAVNNLYAVSENYPNLKADTMFRNLQTELANTEDRIAAARRFYNGNVRDLNALAQMFPSSMVAGMAGVTPQGYFELDTAAERSAPGVKM